MAEKTERRGVYLYIDDKEVRNNVSSINAELRRVQREQEKLTIGSKEYVDATRKIQTLKGILAEHRQQLALVNNEQKKSVSLVDKINNAWTRYGTIIGGVVAGATAFGLAVKGANDLKNSLEDAQESLKALTGLDEGSIGWLTEEAKTLSTEMEKSGLRVRQSADEILQAFMLVGSAKPELLGNKQALKDVTVEALRLSAASGMSLKPAVDALAQSLNMFGAEASDAAKYANILAAGSKAGAADVESVAKTILKSGVAAAQAKIPMEELVGSIETLAERGIKGEVAGTGLRSTILKLLQSADETNPKVVGLAQALDNLAAKGLDTQQMVKMFGLESYTVAQTLVDLREKVKSYTQAVTDTNIATEQAAINSNTASAILAQAGNRFKLAAIELANRLSPALRVSTNSMVYIVKIMPAIIDFFVKWAKEIVAVTAAVLSYNLAVKIAAERTLIVNTATKAWAVTCGVASAASNLLQAAVYALGLDFNLAGTHMTMATTQLKAFNIALKLSPLGVFVTIMTAGAFAVAKFVEVSAKFSSSQKMIATATERANAEIKTQQKHISDLKAKVDDGNLSYDERIKALDELKRLVPGYHADLTKEGQLINENTEALDRYNFQLQKEAKIKALEEQIKEAERYNDAFNALMGSRQGVGVAMMTTVDQQRKIVEEQKKALAELREELYKTMESVYVPSNASSTPTTTPTDDGNVPTPTGNAEKESEKQKRVRKAIAAIDAEYDRLAIEEKKKYLAGLYETDAEYQQRIQDLEIESLMKKLEIAGLEPKQREQIAEKIQDIKVKLYQQVKKLDLYEAVSEEEKLRKSLDANRKKEDEELALLRNAHEKGIILEEDYSRMAAEVRQKWQTKNLELEQKAADKRVQLLERQFKSEISAITIDSMRNGEGDDERNARILSAQKRFYEELLADKTISEEKRLEIQEKYNNLIQDSINKDYEEIKQKNLNLFRALEDAGSGFGEELAKFITDTETSLGDFAKSVIKLTLDTLEKIVLAAVAERTVKNIASLGVYGIAKAAAEIALITAAFETAKAAIGNFWTGGYTSPGAWNQPMGTVHAGEFVANRAAVGNPELRPTLDLIDAAQRTNTVSRLTAADIAAVAGSNSKTNDKSLENKAVIGALERTQALLSKLEAKLDEPLHAYTTVSGQGGIKEGNELYEQMMKNKSR